MDSFTSSSTSTRDSVSEELESLRLRSSSKLDLLNFFEGQGAGGVEQLPSGYQKGSATTQGGTDYPRNPDGARYDEEKAVRKIKMPQNHHSRKERGGQKDRNQDLDTIKGEFNITDISDGTDYDPFAENPQILEKEVAQSAPFSNSGKGNKTVRFAESLKKGRSIEMSNSKNKLSQSIPATKKRRHFLFHKSSKEPVSEERSPSSEYSPTPENSQLYVDIRDEPDHNIEEPFSSVSDLPVSLFSNKDSGTHVSSESENQAIQNPYETANLVPSSDRERDSNKKLERVFKQLSLGPKSPDKAGSQKGFSLRLKGQNTGKGVDSKSIENLSSEQSLDQADILDQNPPDLPTVCSDFKSDSPTIRTIPLLDSLSDRNTNVEVNDVRSKKIYSCFKITLMKLLQTIDVKLNFDSMSLEDLMQKTEEVSQICSDKMNGLKVQQIKLNKQLGDSESRLTECANVESSLKKTITRFQNEVSTLSERCLNYEKSIVFQAKLMDSERKQLSSLQQQLTDNLSRIASVEAQLDSKTSILEGILNLVNSQSGSNTTEENLLGDLHNLLGYMGQLKENERDFISKEDSHNELISKLHALLEKEKTENERNKDIINSTNKKLIEQEKEEKRVLEEKKELITKLNNTERHVSELQLKNKSLESQWNDTRFQLLDLDQKFVILESEKLKLNSALDENVKVANEQLKLMEEMTANIDEQTGQLELMRNQISLLSEEKAQAKAYGETVAHELSLLTDKFNAKSEECETLIRNRAATLKHKEDAIKSLKNEINGMRQEQLESSEEIRRIRMLLSDKTSEVSTISKSREAISKSLDNYHEKNRSLRSEVLRTYHVKQELKRTMIDISVCFVKELDGLIDDSSLSNIKQSLAFDMDDDVDDEKCIEKLNDITLFIQEAVSLVIKEYWNLTKRLLESQKHTLSSSSMSTLQRINGIQARKLIKLEKKLQYYEQALKKINSVNDGSSHSHFHTRHSGQASDKPNEGSSESENSSLKSSPPTETMLREKQSEINRILSNVSKKNLDY